MCRARPENLRASLRRDTADYLHQVPQHHWQNHLRNALTSDGCSSSVGSGCWVSGLVSCTACVVALLSSSSSVPIKRDKGRQDTAISSSSLLIRNEDWFQKKQISIKLLSALDAWHDNESYKNMHKQPTDHLSPVHLGRLTAQWVSSHWNHRVTTHNACQKIEWLI